MKHLLLLLTGILAATATSLAQTDNFNTWIEFEFRKDFLKNAEFSLTPEIRLKDQFNVDEYLLKAQLGYALFPFLDLAAAYRVNTEVKSKGNETSYRYELEAQLKKDVARFEASLRGRLTNYSEESADDPGTWFRPRIKMEYDIKNNKISPYTSFELFRNITDKTFQKWRLDAGFTRELGGPHRIGLYYRLHDYFSDKTSMHILGIEYRLRF